MTDQLDPANARDLNTIAGVETEYFFGCWLDVNQPLQKVLPAFVPATNPDRGPWPGAPLHSLQDAFLSAPHQCLIAEISFDKTPIRTERTPAIRTSSLSATSPGSTGRTPEFPPRV